MLEQNVENRNCMYKYDEPFKKIIKITNKNLRNLNDAESKINQTGRENWGPFLLEFEKYDVIYCFSAKKLKLVARAFDDRNKSLS